MLLRRTAVILLLYTAVSLCGVAVPGGYALDPTVEYCGLLSITCACVLLVSGVVVPTLDGASTAHDSSRVFWRTSG